MLQQPLGLAEQKLRVHKRLWANILPADKTGAVDEEGSMQRLLLKIVETAIGFESTEATIGQKRKGDFGSLVILERLLEAIHIVAADGHNLDSSGAEFIRRVANRLQLLGTVQATVTQRKQDNDRLAKIVAEGMIPVAHIAQ